MKLSELIFLLIIIVLVMSKKDIEDALVDALIQPI